MQQRRLPGCSCWACDSSVSWGGDHASSSRGSISAGVMRTEPWVLSMADIYLFIYLVSLSGVHRLACFQSDSPCHGGLCEVCQQEENRCYLSMCDSDPAGPWTPLGEGISFIVHFISGPLYLHAQLPWLPSPPPHTHTLLHDSSPCCFWSSTFPLLVWIYLLIYLILVPFSSSSVLVLFLTP